MLVHLVTATRISIASLYYARVMAVGHIGKAESAARYVLHQVRGEG